MKDDKDNKDIMTDHEYDGIRELDNMLPRWWLASFYITIAFAIGYFAYYELGSGPSIQEEFKQDVAQIEVKKLSTKQESSIDETKLFALVKNSDALAKGKQVFKAKCVSCHGENGQGIIGPNLTDDYWIHGDGKVTTIAKIIHDGVLDKGMPSWAPLLTEEEWYSVAAFVKSLRGTHPPNAKDPQGQLVKE